MMDGESRSDTWPDIQIQNPHVTVAHEATVGRISDDQLFYMGSRGFTEDEAAAMIVNGFIEPVTKELPMEYAVELNRLIQLEMVGSIGDRPAGRRAGPRSHAPPPSASLHIARGRRCHKAVQERPRRARRHHRRAALPAGPSLDERP